MIRWFQGTSSIIFLGTHRFILHEDALAAQGILHDDAYSLLRIALHDAFHLLLGISVLVTCRLRSAPSVIFLGTH